MLEIENANHTLTGVTQLVGHHPAKRKVPSSIPSQGTCLGCRFGPGQGVQPISCSLSCASLSLFLPSFPSL